VVDDVEEASLPPLRLKAHIQWSTHKDDAPVDARHVSGIRFEGVTAAQRQWLARFLK
jgi:hypothetical protein